MTYIALPFARPALKLAPAVAALLAVFPYAAQAQHDQEQVLEPVVITATRTPQKVSEVISDTTVITSEDIARSGHTSVVDLLQGRRGIEVTRNGGPGNNASVFIRGAENKQNIVLIDGVRVGSSTSGGANWSAIPLSQVDRIEIVHGPLSSLYGSDAMGGVIQIFTKKGEGKPVATASIGAGSYGTYTLDAGISGSALANGRLSYAINAGHEKSDGFSAKKPGTSGYNPDKDGYERNSVSGQFGYEFAAGHELGFSFLKSELDGQYDNNASLDDRLTQHLESYSLSTRNRFAPNWESHIQIGRSKDKGTTRSTSFSRFETVQDYLSWQNDITVGKDDLFQVMVERREEKVDSTTTELNRERTTNSVAAAYQLHLGPHLASVSIRNDDSSQFGSHTTGSIGYGYRLSESLRVNASYGTSFRAPTFNELYFPDFGAAANRPEKGKNAEVGIHYNEGATHLSAVYYRNRIRDLIVNTDPCPLPGYNWGCAYNVNQAILEGWSLSAETRTGDFIWRGTLDLQDPRDVTTNRRLARRAKQHGTLAAEYATGNANVGAEVVFSGDRFDNASNTNKLHGYSLLNLYASRQISKEWSVFGRWDNVLDKDYELARGYATAGRSLFVGVRYGMR